MIDNRINIIHISDTHISSALVNDLNRVTSSLINDIRELLNDEELKSTIVCFTGDLIQRGDYGYSCEKQYELALYNFLLPLLEGLSINLSNFFIVPGNHEIDLTKINKIYDEGLNKYLANYRGKLEIDYPKENQLRERLEGFRKFESEINGDSENNKIVNSKVITVNNQNIGVCLINTSWNLASDSANDKGKIIVGANLLYNEFQKIKECRYKICLMHHSLSWLRDEDTYEVEPLLSKFDVVLCGHSHYSNDKQITSPNGKTIFCMASQILPLTSNTGYNLIRIDSNVCTVMQRQYYYQRDAFDANLQIENGEQKFTIKNEDAQTLIFNTCLKTKKGFFNKLNTVSITCLIDDKKHSFDSYYVVPKLTYEIDDTLEGKNNEKKKQLVPADIIRSKDNFVVYGKKDYGKSLLLYYIAEQYYNMVEERKLPIIIDCKKIKDKEKSILIEIRNYLQELAQDDYKISLDDISDMLNSGNCVLLFDDFSSQEKNAKTIAEFIKKYHKNKRVFTITQSPTSILENKIADELDEETYTVKYKRVYMCFMSKNDIRKMAHNLSSCEATELTSFTNRIVACFNKTYLPRTPFAVALVVSVCNINSDYEPVNLAAVIKRFMEMILDRLSPKELLSNEFNFEIKEDFLAFIAYKMVNENLFDVPIDMFDKWVAEYHEFNGFSIRDSHFNEYFFATNVLFNNNGKVSFKYACLLEYYIGKRASLDKNFLDEILAKNRFLNYISELIYCAGLDARNTQIVETLGQYLNEYIDESKIDTSFLSGDRIKLDLSIDEQDIKVNVIEKQMSENEVDRLTDTKDNSSEYLPTNINKGQAYDESKLRLDYYDILLDAFGSAIRNTELTGYQKRYAAFKNYMKGALYWCSCLAYSVDEFIKVIRRDIFEKREVLDEKNILKIEEIFRDFCRIAIPLMAEENMVESVGTKKLGRIFLDYYNSINDFTSLDKFLALLVTLDLKLSNWKEMFDDFLKNNTSKDLNIVLFFKMILLYKICHFGKANNSYLAERLFILSKQINKDAGALYGKNKTKFINAINEEQIKFKKDN